MINPRQLYSLIYRTLLEYNLYSDNAVKLVYGTISHESNRGAYLKQRVKKFDITKHALGIAQIEKKTFNWLCDLHGKKYNFERFDFERLEYDLKFSILICRLRYLPYPDPIPKEIYDLAGYYKKYYNTDKGEATKEDFIKALKSFPLL